MKIFVAQNSENNKIIKTQREKDKKRDQISKLTRKVKLQWPTLAFRGDVAAVVETIATRINVSYLPSSNDCNEREREKKWFLWYKIHDTKNVIHGEQRIELFTRTHCMLSFINVNHTHNNHRTIRNDRENNFDVLANTNSHPRVLILR